MSLFEFDQEEYDRNRFEEGKAVGVLEGERSKAVETARRALQLGLSVEQIMQLTGLSCEEITNLS